MDIKTTLPVPIADLTIRYETGIQVRDQLNDAPNTADFTVLAWPALPDRALRSADDPGGGSRVTIYDPATATRLFGGYIQTVDETIAGQPRQRLWQTSAIDYTWTLNKYRPYGRWTKTSASTIVEDLIDQFAPGFTHDHVQTGLKAISIAFDGTQTLSEALTAVGQMLGGGHWYVEEADPATSTPPDVHFFHTVPNPPTAPLPRPPGPTTPPSVAAGVATTPPITSPPVYALFATAFEYADGTFSEIGTWTSTWAGTPFLLAANTCAAFSSVVTGATDVDHGAVVARCVMAQTKLSLGDPISGPAIWCRVGDNTTTAFTDTFATQTTPPVTHGGGYLPDEGDGPDLETDDPPDDLTDDSPTLQWDPPPVVTRDYSQIRTRVGVRGMHVVTVEDAADGDTSVKVPLEATAFLAEIAHAPAWVQIGWQVVSVDFITTATTGVIFFSTPLVGPVLAGTPVAMWAQCDDLEAQADLGAVELDASGAPTDGIHEYVLADDSLTKFEDCQKRGNAELQLFSRPIVTLRYTTRDVKTHSGKLVTVNLTAPACHETLKIQDVTIDQIGVHPTTPPRFQVTATSVKLTIDDFPRAAVQLGTTVTGS